MKRLDLSSLFLVLLISGGSLFISCSSDDGDEPVDELVDTEPSLSLTVGSESYSVQFGPNDVFPGFAVGGATTMTTTINASDGTTIAIGIVLGGQTAGQYTVTASLDDSDDFAPGMDLALLNIPNSLSQDLAAESMTVNISSYQSQNTIAVVGGTFSGTMRDQDTQDVINVSGSFQTGFNAN